MDTLLGTYSSLLVPVVITLVLVIVLVKILIAIEHAVIKLASSLLTIIVLGAVLIAGISLLGRINTIQSAVQSAVQSAAAAGLYNKNGTTSASALTRQLDRSVRKMLADVGLNPAYLRLRVTCGPPQAQLHVSYPDPTFMSGALNHQDFAVPLPQGMHCSP